MEHLFRLVLTRPAVKQDENAPSIPLTQPTDFQTKLAGAQQTANPRQALKSVASQFVATAAFVGDPDALSFRDQLKALAAALDALEKKEVVANDDVANAIKEQFGDTPAQLVANHSLESSTEALKDSLIAIKLLPEEQRRRVEELARQLRDLELISRVAGDTSFPGTGAALRRYRRRSMQMPGEAALGSALSTEERRKELEERRKEEEEQKRKDAETKLDLYKRLNAAISELTNLNSHHFQNTPQNPSDGFHVPTQYRGPQLVMQEITQREQVAKLDLTRLQAAVQTNGKVEFVDRFHTAEVVTAEVAPKSRLSELALSGKGPFTPLAQVATAFVVTAAAERSLSGSTLELLKQRGLSVAVNPIDSIVHKLRAEVMALTNALDTLLGRPVRRSFKRIGTTLVMTSTPLSSVWNDLVVAGDLTLHGPMAFNMSVPDSHGDVAPAGVADLLVVKQQLVRYEGADVAHIENVLKGERKEHEHTTRRETEEFTLRETETTVSEERELESTTRFEMSRETSQTIKEDATLKAGLTVSGKYGPSVDFSASAEGSVSRSKEEATKAAASYSQDVTERSATRITERVLERTSLRVTNEVIDRNMHLLDNVAGTGHIAGVYQWVNKVYQAQMFNYGVRMMYDFMVPEPAAFLISSLQSAHATALELEKPSPFTHRPDQITMENYYGLIQQYGATDVAPPPEEYKTKSIDFNAGGAEHGANYNHSSQVQIDEGYKALFGTVAALKNTWDTTATVDVALGSRVHRFPLGDWVWSTSLNDERDSIPFAFNTSHVKDIDVAVEIKCQRTERALVKWQLETHAKITTAYKARLSEYEEKIAALEVQAGVAIRGRNPFLNLELMNDELKKHCITIMTEQHFDLFDAVSVGSFGVPQINITENVFEGPYVRFFEQAFEWEQMTWLTYPYFWGRKSQWHERIAYEDADPVFNQFLKAGYCRVVVPVRPGFEGAIDHFMARGEVWNGGPLPTISTKVYLPIADEIAERLDRPGDEIPQGDPWLVRVPTTLVHLRKDDKLPQWQQDAAGNWVEV